MNKLCVGAALLTLVVLLLTAKTSPGPDGLCPDRRFALALDCRPGELDLRFTFARPSDAPSSPPSCPVTLRDLLLM
jgi:hypothetical protein